MRKTIALIDPFTSAAYLSNSLLSAGVYTIAIFTKTPNQINNYFKINSDLFDKQFILNDSSIKNMMDVLQPFKIDYIINGNEFSTGITDQLCKKLLPSLANNPNTSDHRSNKFQMQEVLKASGLPYISQNKLKLSDIQDYLIDKKICFPCFCKPLKGLGTIGAFKASDQKELLNGIQNVLSKGIVSESDEYLVQEYIDGQEFFVDAFSYQGSHYISSIQMYQRQLVKGVPVLRYSEIVYDKKLWERCANFVKQTLTATQFFNGFSHTEIFLTQDNQIKLIEINPRISGGNGFCNKLAKSLSLYSQIDLLLSSLNGNIQESSVSDIRGYSRRLYLFNWSKAPLRDPSEHLKNISTVQLYKLLNPVGHINTSDEKYVTNIDLFVLLHSKVSADLEIDTRRLFDLEEQGLLL